MPLGGSGRDYSLCKLIKKVLRDCDDPPTALLPCCTNNRLVGYGRETRDSHPASGGPVALSGPHTTMNGFITHLDQNRTEMIVSSVSNPNCSFLSCVYIVVRCSHLHSGQPRFLGLDYKFFVPPIDYLLASTARNLPLFLSHTRDYMGEQQYSTCTVQAKL
ncbi:hypothetical protein BD289DRAFT_31200 [Coniella lustricola]|uniref:Uncharacterized protein n=1 Tax=Coniella lustricola TaxID=2025994 RepID=A0A2T3A2U1_9PEZI|nr:hypothetical protein BD289DRAFT_31200 [Coniella lustricola]